MANVMEFTCRICGAACIGYPRSRYCAQCRKKVRLETLRKAKARAAEKKRAERAGKGGGEDRLPAPTLGQIAARARSLHMSYGEFVAKYGI